MALSTRLRELMVARGLSQRQLADLAGVSPPQVSHWLSGRYVPSTSSIRKLARGLEVSADTLFRESTAPVEDSHAAAVASVAKLGPVARGEHGGPARGAGGPGHAGDGAARRGALHDGHRRPALRPRAPRFPGRARHGREGGEPVTFYIVRPIEQWPGTLTQSPEGKA